MSGLDGDLASRTKTLTDQTKTASAGARAGENADNVLLSRHDRKHRELNASIDRTLGLDHTQFANVRRNQESLDRAQAQAQHQVQVQVQRVCDVTRFSRAGIEGVSQGQGQLDRTRFGDLRDSKDSLDSLEVNKTVLSQSTEERLKDMKAASASDDRYMDTLFLRKNQGLLENLAVDKPEVRLYQDLLKTDDISEDLRQQLLAILKPADNN